MEQETFSINLAGVPLDIRPLRPETQQFFGAFLDSGRSGFSPVAVTEAELQAVRGLYPGEMSLPVLEFNELAPRAADALLPYGRCLFHSVAFLWRGMAYLITGPSGTGKTTQYVLWKLLLGDQVSILNGDKPVLEWNAGGSIWVHPSPWKGKEGMGRLVSAPLGGVICLAQGERNHVSLLRPEQAALPLFGQFLFTASSEQDVRRVCALEEALLRNVPVWELVNRGDFSSVQLARDTILKFEEERL